MGRGCHVSSALSVRASAAVACHQGTSTCYCPSISTKRYWLPLWSAGKAMAVQTYNVCLTGHQFGWKGDQAPTRWSLIRPLTKIYSQENYLDFGKSVFDQKYGYGNVGGLHIWTHIDAPIQWERRELSPPDISLSLKRPFRVEHNIAEKTENHTHSFCDDAATCQMGYIPILITDSFLRPSLYSGDILRGKDLRTLVSLSVYCVDIFKVPLIIGNEA